MSVPITLGGGTGFFSRPTAGQLVLFLALYTIPPSPPCPPAAKTVLHKCLHRVKPLQKVKPILLRTRSQQPLSTLERGPVQLPLWPYAAMLLPRPFKLLDVFLPLLTSSSRLCCPYCHSPSRCSQAPAPGCAPSGAPVKQVCYRMESSCIGEREEMNAAAPAFMHSTNIY